MALKAVIAKLEDVAEAFRSLYKPKDGQFVLDVEGMVTDEDHDAVNAKLAEFRDNNRKLHTENDALKKQFEGVDPAEVKTLREKVAGFEKQGVKQPDDLAAQIASAVEKAVGPIQTKLDASEKAKLEADSLLQRKNLEDELWKVGATAGILETARTDYLGRAMRVFEWKDGKPVAVNGDAPLYSKRKGKVTEPLTPEEWAIEWLPTEGSHLFKPSKGASAQNNGDRTGGPRVIANDMASLGSNLEALAKGEMTVQGTV